MLELSQKNIERFDKNDMFDLICRFPDQCIQALSIAEKASVNKKYKSTYHNIVFLGLGGSAIGADLIKSYLIEECSLPIFVVRDYSIPSFLNKDSLVFAVSYSGNTEETLSMYKKALKKKAKIIVVTSGGKLEALAIKNNNALVKIPQGYPPRTALGFSFIPPLVLLGKLGIVKNKSAHIRRAVSVLKSMLERDLNPKKNNISKQLAKTFYNRVPVFYSANTHFDVVSVRWRGQLAENSKALSSMHVYPEMNHNEIVGWQHPDNMLKSFIAVNLRDKMNHSRVKLRMDISSKILKRAGFRCIDIYSKGDEVLSRILSLMYIGDFVSFYLAILYGINPTPVERISYLKGELAKRN